MRIEKNLYKNRLDVDSGYITRSPCRDCPDRWNLPNCSKGCIVLSRLQSLLAGSVMCSQNFSEKEAYSIGR